MNVSLKSTQIANGIRFSAVKDKHFKTNRISVNLITTLDKNTVTVNALIPQILKDGFLGCENFTKLNRRLEELYGAYIDADVQKRGDSQVLAISITGIDDVYSLNGEAITKEMAKILCDMILHPLIENDGFSKKYTELEKNVLKDIIDAQINEKRSYAINHMIGIMCKDEPFGIPKYGFKEDIPEITSQNVKTQYDNLLKSAQIEIMFTGCGDENPIIEVFKQAFSAVKRNYNKVFVTSPHFAGDSSVYKIEKMSVNQSKMVLGFANGLSPLSEKNPAVRLMIAVLGGTPSSKLFLNVREKLSLCYYCASQYDFYKCIGIIDCGVEKQNIEKAKAEILVQFNEIKNGNVTDKEMQSAVLSLKNSYSTIGESDFLIESFYLRQLLTGTNFTPEQEKEKIDRVKKQDVIDAAKMFKLDTVYLLTGKDGD